MIKGMSRIRSGYHKTKRARVDEIMVEVFSSREVGSGETKPTGEPVVRGTGSAFGALLEIGDTTSGWKASGIVTSTELFTSVIPLRWWRCLTSGALEIISAGRFGTARTKGLAYLRSTQ